MQGTTDLEDISKSILCNQFVAGLLSDIKIIVAGTEGNFETLLTKARFKEIKFRQLGGMNLLLIKCRTLDSMQL